MSKRIFLIDTENTNDYSFINKLDVNMKDEIVFFQTKNSKNIKFHTMSDIIRCKAKLNFETIEIGGRNSLDHQLVFYLAIKIARDRSSKYYIVSKDKGFLHTINYAKKLIDVNVEIISTEERANEKTIDAANSSLKNQECNNLTNKVDEIKWQEFQKVLNDAGIKDAETYAKKINDMIHENKSRSKIHNTLVSIYGEKGKNIYKYFKNTCT